jgi:uncharacterized membrane protein HdeD (DUF308 family)
MAAANPVPLRPGPVGHALLSHWWVLLVRGILAILFGIAALSMPQVTVILLIALFATFALLDGIVSIISAIRHRDWGWQFFGGILSIAIGVLTIAWPVSAGFALIILIAAWAITRGVFDITAAITLRHVDTSLEWVLILSGIVSILFGLFIAFWPLVGALAIVGAIAGFSIFLGITLIAAGFRQRNMYKLVTGPAPGHAV